MQERQSSWSVVQVWISWRIPIFCCQCVVCRTEVGNNSIYCNGCKHWVHKKCNGLKRLSCENSLKEVQRATTSSYIPLPLLQDLWPYVQLLHVSETWSLTKAILQNLQRNDRVLIRQICTIKPEVKASAGSSEPLIKLELDCLDLILRERERGLRWFGHVECSSGAVIRECDIQAGGRWGQGCLTWKKLMENWQSWKGCEICYKCS